MSNEYIVGFADRQQSYFRLLNAETAEIPEKVIKLGSVPYFIRLVPDLTQWHDLNSSFSGIDVLGVIEGDKGPVEVKYSAWDSETVASPSKREAAETLADLLDCYKEDLCPKKLNSFFSEVASFSCDAANVMVEHLERMEAAAMELEPY